MIQKLFGIKESKNKLSAKNYFISSVYVIWHVFERSGIDLRSSLVQAFPTGYHIWT
jgi:hypothetical protein